MCDSCPEYNTLDRGPAMLFEEKQNGEQSKPQNDQIHDLTGGGGRVSAVREDHKCDVDENADGGIDKEAFSCIFLLCLL